MRARIEESAARVIKMKSLSRVGMPAPTAMLASLLGTPAHKALAASFKRGAPPASSPAASSPVTSA